MTTTDPTLPRTPAEALRMAADRWRREAIGVAEWDTEGALRRWADELDAVPAVYALPPEPPGVLAEVAEERQRQDEKWGEQNHPDGTGGPVMQSRAEEARAQCQFLAANGGSDWRAILLEEVYEALAEEDPAALRTELIQVAAVAVQWVQAIDRRGPLSTTPPAGAGRGLCEAPGDTLAGICGRELPCPTHPPGTPPADPPRGACPKCGRLVRLYRDGRVWAHDGPKLVEGEWPPMQCPGGCSWPAPPAQEADR